MGTVEITSGRCLQSIRDTIKGTPWRTLLGTLTIFNSPFPWKQKKYWAYSMDIGSPHWKLTKYSPS
jgi:hypothetical protein